MSNADYIKTDSNNMIKNLKPFFYHQFFYIYFFSSVNMSKDSNIIKKEKKRVQKKLVKGIKIFLKKKKAKNDDMFANDIKAMSIEKILQSTGKKCFTN